MSISAILGLGQTALELGLISSLTVLALFLSYTMLNVCDLSTDGCFTLGAAVGAMVAISASFLKASLPSRLIFLTATLASITLRLTITLTVEALSVKPPA